MAKRMLVLALLALAATLATAVPALAQPTTHPLHPVYSNVRAQIGNGLPLPITFTPAPRGRILPVSGATVMQGTTGAQPSIIISPTQLSAPAKTLNIGVWKSNNKLFQVQTSAFGKFPKAKATLKAGGRTGPANVTWCPGLSLPTAAYNPSCYFPTPSADPRTLLINSALRYSKTVGQFGGIAQNGAGGVGPGGRAAVVAARGSANPPCTIGTGMCIAAFDTVVPAPTGAQGAPFGFKITTAGVPAVKPGVFLVTAAGPSVLFPGALGGTIIGVGAGFGTGFTNMATSWGGPWTTGMLTIVAQNTANLGTEQFTLTGSDFINPTNGTRLISLVSGAMSQRTLSKPNANRGWMTLHLPEPGALLGTVGALLALVGCHRLMRRRD